MRDVINNAKAECEYKMDNILSKLDINLAQDKVKAIQLLENEFSNMYSQAERDIYINIVATYFSIDKSSVKADVERMRNARIKAQRSDTAEDARKTLLGYQDRVNPDYARAPAVARHEENVLGLLLLYPEHRKKVFEEKLLTEDNFFTALNKRIFKYISQTYHEEAPGDINEIFTPEEVGRITKMKLARMNLLNNGDDVLLESINALKSSMLKKSVTACTSIDEMNDIINRLRSGDDNK
jgi:DNA primase